MQNPEMTYDLFLSYAQPDEAWVHGYLLDALEQAHIRVWTKEEFRPGLPLVAEYERAVTQSRFVVLVLTPAYRSEDFGDFVDFLANSYGRRSGSWPVIPLLLQPTPLPERLGHLVPVDATQPAQWPAALARIAGLLQMPIDPATQPPPCPYPGLVAYSEAQAALFFGRESVIEDATERLRQHPFLAIIGPSGSGKSSLVFAGIIPALRASRRFGAEEWNVLSMRPGATPLVSLSETLGLNPSTLQLNGPRADGGKPTLLVIDQFEELFSYQARAQRPTAQEDPTGPFLSALGKLMEQPNLYILLTARADYYPELMDCSLWREIQANRLELSALGEEGLRAAITRPGAQVGVTVDGVLVERLVADAAGEVGALPLVQEALLLLWEKLERRFLPAFAYAQLAQGKRNGLQAAIDRRATIVYANLPAAGKPIARRIFLRLIQVGDGRMDSRRQQPLSRLRSPADNPQVFEDTLQELAAKRLIVLSSSTDGKQRLVDVAHEALIQRWPLYQEWIHEKRTDLGIQRRVAEAAQQWQEGGQNPSDLYRGKRLAEALQGESWQEGSLNEQEVAFLVRSRQAQEQRRLGIGLAALATLLIIGAGIAAVTGQLNRWLYPPPPMAWSPVRAGVFTMGSSQAEIGAANAIPERKPPDVIRFLADETPSHPVYLDDYSINTYEVTFQEYGVCVRAGVCNPPAQSLAESSGGNLPVVGVNWEEARTYCVWVGGDLPSEAQWEKAARGPSANPSRYPWGNDVDPAKANVLADGVQPVGSFQAGVSAYGVQDMAGNVWEWVYDYYAEETYQRAGGEATDNPRGPETGERRVLRGGSYENDWVEARSTHRNSTRPGDGHGDVGFRCVISSADIPD
ncbi:MAG: SUMF1/EgtB/PvdO family nonheme iron enzyme [Caldilineaceae bacterium]|nr:SUMF1/EgtB/PvdO family nonheme iron enzyme [Caldilineaceae bacterium]